MAHVRLACAEFLEATSQFYKVSDCDVRVLAARPLRVREHWTSELFGDYSAETMLIRVWMRTAVRKEVTSFGTFLSTLCHEFCHHPDFQRFGFADSWHFARLLRKGRRALSLCEGNAIKETILGSFGRWGAGELIGNAQIAQETLTRLPFDPVALSPR